MTVVGAAEVVVSPNTLAFERELEAGTSPAFGKVSKDAEKAGQDSGSKLTGGMKKGLGGFESLLGNLGVPLGSFGGHLDKTAASMAQVEGHGKGMTSTLAGLGGGVLLGATAGVIGFGAASVDAASKYQGATTTIAANANISDAAAKKVSDSFLGTAGKTIFSAQEIATAYGEVAGVLGAVNGKALTAAQANKVMAASMDLAEASGVSLGTATDALAKIMQAYKLGVGEAGKASDILFNASRVTGIELGQLTAALSRVKAKLGDLAPSLGESAGLLDALAKNGVTGRAAISALSSGFNTLVGGGKPAKEMAKQLGVEIFNSSHQFVGMKSIIEQLAPKLGNLTQESQLQATKALFGATANRQLLGVILQGPAAYAANTAAVTRQGAAHQAAEKQAQTFSHQIDHLKATAVDMAIKLGNILIPKLVSLEHTLSDGISWLTKHKEAAKALAIVIATVLSVAVAVFVEQKAVAFSRSLGKMVSDMGVLASGIKSGVTKIVGYFAAEDAAAETSAATMETTGTEIVASADATAVGVDSALGATGIGLVIVALGVGVTELALHWEESMEALEKATAAAGNFIIGILNEIIEGFNSTIGELTGDIGKIGEIKVGNEYGESNKEEEENEAEGTSHETGRAGSESTILKGLMKGGVSKTAAEGIIKALGGESNLSPTEEGSEGAYGIAQWLGSRRKGLEQFAGSTHQSGNSLSTQIQYLIKELHGPEAHTLAALKGAKSPEDAERLFVEKFERPESAQIPKILDRGKSYGANVEKHAKATHEDTTAIEKHAKALTGHGTIKTSEELAAAHKKPKKGPSESAYADPFAGAQGLKRGREDEGIDYTMTPGSKIGAIGAGKVTDIVQNWFKGQPLLEYELTKGAEKGKHVYLAEQIDPKVKVGDKLKAGQTIATYAASGTGIEMGFGAGGGRTLAQATTGYKEGQKTPAAAEFAKFLASVGKGGSALQTASLVFQSEQKAVAALQKHEATRIASDQKVGSSTLNKMVAAIHSGGVKQLQSVLGGVHDKNLKVLEKQLDADHAAALKGMAGAVEKEHASQLSKLVTKLNETHKKALEALQVALVKAAEKASTERLHHDDAINADIANSAATAIADATKVTLDHAAEAGKTGAELIAAQAQTNLDAIKASDDAAIGAAKVAADRAAGSGELAEAQAARALADTENQAKINEANAQAQLDLATNAQSEAQAAASKAEQESTKATEAQTKATEELTEATEKSTKAESTGSSQPIVVNIYQPSSAGDVITELGWQLKTGSLPPPATQVPVAV